MSGSPTKKARAGPAAGFGEGLLATQLVGNSSHPTSKKPQSAVPAAAAGFGASPSSSLPPSQVSFTQEGGFLFGASFAAPLSSITSPAHTTQPQGAGGFAGTSMASATAVFGPAGFNIQPHNPISPPPGTQLQASSAAAPLAEQPALLPASQALLSEMMEQLGAAAAANANKLHGTVLEELLAAHGAHITTDGRIVVAEQAAPMDISIMCPSVQMAEAPPLMPGQLGPPNMLQPNTQSSPVQYGSQKKPKPDKIHGWKLMMQKKIKFKNLKF